jgi:hypothetical protein
MSSGQPKGPIDDASWPASLEAEVVDPGPPPRLHGYDVWNDLVPNYAFAELALTALRGSPPQPAEGRAFEIGLGLLSPSSIREAPAHAAALTRMLGAGPAAVVATATTLLAEQAEALVDAHRRWLAWLAAAQGDPPAEVLAASDDDRHCLAVIREHVEAELCSAVVRFDLTADAAVVALLHACGLTRPRQLVAAIVLARMPAVLAEADRHRPSRLHTYPMTVPPFAYEEDEP